MASSVQRAVSHEIGNIAPVVFSFWLMIASAYMPELAGCQVRRLLEHYMLAKHFVGVAMVYYCLIVIDDTFSSKPLALNILYSFWIYFVFLLTTRMPLRMFIAVLFMLFVMYHLRKNEKTEQDKQRVAVLVQRLGVATLILIAIGVVEYAYDKQEEYGKNFSWWTFFDGKVKCRYN